MYLFKNSNTLKHLSYILKICKLLFYDFILALFFTAQLLANNIFEINLT